MNKLIIYESTDGSQWDHPSEALYRDGLDLMVSRLEAILPRQPNSPGVRVRVNKADAEEVKEEVVAMCRNEFPNEKVFLHDAKDIHPMGYAGRFLSGLPKDHPLDRIWQWFCCYNDGWLYQQPFYALNPDRFVEDK